MMKGRVVPLYLLMLLAHVAHVFEEIWSGFWLIDVLNGLGWFLVGNWVLFCIPVALFYYVLHENRRAYTLSIIYAGIMFLNGVGHNIATIVTGRYFGGFAGGYTGISFIIIAPLLIYYLKKERRRD